MRTNQPAHRRLRVHKTAVQSAALQELGATTDYAIAQALNVHPATISLLFTGKNEPSEKFIVAALSELKRPFEQLFFIEVVQAATATIQPSVGQKAA